jgi:hypothetical protein
VNEDLAEALAAQLRPLPFTQRVVGLARPYDQDQEESFDGKPVTRRIRTPYPVTFPPAAASCDQDERYLLPDANTASTWWFEDLGTVEVIVKAVHFKESTLRLLGWLNPTWFDPAPTESQILDALWRTLRIGQPQTIGPYATLTLTATMLPGDVNLLSRYTYAQDAVPLLYPPYKLFGLELKARYLYRPACPIPELPAILEHPVSC